MFLTALAFSLVAQPATPAACGSEAHKAFNFWVGDWRVRPNVEGADYIARSVISREANGCAIIERWKPDQGQPGISVNALHADGKWHQRWVGGGGAIVEFVGGPNEDGQMVLEGIWPGAAGPGSEPLVRMTYTKRENGTVRQYGQQSTDGGETWTDSFDFIYWQPPKISFPPPPSPPPGPPVRNRQK